MNSASDQGKVWTSHGQYASDYVTAECPISCLGLASAVALALRKYGNVETVGDLLALAERNEIGVVKGVGSVRERDIKLALVFAGFSFGHRYCHRDDIDD